MAQRSDIFLDWGSHRTVILDVQHYRGPAGGISAHGATIRKAATKIKFACSNANVCCEKTFCVRKFLTCKKPDALTLKGSALASTSLTRSLHATASQIPSCKIREVKIFLAICRPNGGLKKIPIPGKKEISFGKCSAARDLLFAPRHFSVPYSAAPIAGDWYSRDPSRAAGKTKLRRTRRPPGPLPRASVQVPVPIPAGFLKRPTAAATIRPFGR
jgi:hypothetical protein